MKIFEVNGNDYQMGYGIGKVFKPYLNSVIGEYMDALPDYMDRIRLLESKLAASLPNCLAELYGRADGAGVERNAMLLYMFPEICGRTDGCTTVTIKTADNVLFAHNEDDRNFNEDNVALVRYNYEKGYVFAYTMACRMAGSAFAVNDRLIFSSNYIFGGRLELDNVSRYIILRDVINASSIDEVEQKLSRYEAASPFSLNVVDKYTLEAVNFEKDIDKLYRKDVLDRHARSNHFVLKEADKSRVPQNSIFRNLKAKELLSAVTQPSVAALEDILAYEADSMDTSIYQNSRKYPDKIVTVATFSADIKKGELHVLDFVSDKLYTFDLDAHLKSEQPLKN